MHLDRENHICRFTEAIHMDDAVGSVGSTYGLTAEDREPYFLITSFAPTKAPTSATRVERCS